MKHCSCNLSHEFNSSLQDDQSVEEESSAAREEVEQEVTEEVDLMYGDETFEEEGGEEAGNGDERGGEENLATEEAFEGEQEEEQEDEVRAEVEYEIEEIISSSTVEYTDLFHLELTAASFNSWQNLKDPLEEDIEVPQSEEERRHLR